MGKCVKMKGVENGEVIKKGHGYVLAMHSQEVLEWMQWSSAGIQL